MKTVTVILNGYKRKHTLKKQIESLKNQSYPIERIVYFTLKSDYPEDYEYLRQENIELIECSNNYGVYGRFSIALNFESDFIYIMDDDIIPGSNFIKTCVECCSKVPGVYGSSGLRRREDADFNQLHNLFDFFGWIQVMWGNEGNLEPVKVSYLCNGWFFPRQVLFDFWREGIYSDISVNRKVAEDMHLSYTAWKYSGLCSYVVPQNKYDLTNHGNICGLDYSEDEYAIHRDEKLLQIMNNNFLTYCEKGLPCKFE